MKCLYVGVGNTIPAGGMYEYLAAWVHEAASQGHEAAAVTPDSVALGGQKCRHFTLSSPIPWDRAHRLAGVSALIGANPARRIAGQLRSVVAGFKPTLIHFVDLLVYSDYLVRQIAEVVPATILITLHDPVFHVENVSLPTRLLKNRMRRELCVLAAKRRNVFIHVHDIRLLSGVSEEFKNSKVIELPHPLTRCRTVRSRGVWLNGAGPLRIGFMGRIEEYKGIGNLLSALESAFLKQKVRPSEIELRIVGRGPLDRTRCSQLPCAVEVCNEFVSDQVFHQILADLDLLVLPYDSATQSGVAAMAAAYGIPMLATDTGALSAFVQHGRNGWLVSVDSATESISGILADLTRDRSDYQQVWAGAQEMKYEHKVGKLECLIFQ